LIACGITGSAIEPEVENLTRVGRTDRSAVATSACRRIDAGQGQFGCVTWTLSGIKLCICDKRSR